MGLQGLIIKNGRMYKECLTEFSPKELSIPISKLNGRLEDMIIVFVGATLEDVIRTRLKET